MITEISKKHSIIVILLFFSFTVFSQNGDHKIFLLFEEKMKTVKENDKCLIIKIDDNKSVYKIGTIANNDKHFYLLLRYPNPKKNKKYENPLVDILAPKNPKEVSYNLQNRQEIKSLPDSINSCNCESLENFNLGMKFKLYIEKENGWISYDAQDFLVEE